ncbi:hypothetical protein PIB30_018993 [Stylosanthes scabra]|uniref:Uncharacterized protein n=1 Tax=Stylosanthes scabra TaxID=79078 RepID=A0ABU6Q7Y0_9FABA|nr:hypothetical protein [Stylosanthes scabra]
MGWEEAWERTISLVNEWTAEKNKKKNIAKNRVVTDELLGPCWWQCCLYEEEDEGGAIKVWMGEEIEENNQGEACLKDIESALQFMLEDLSLRDENTMIFLERKDFVAWINGNHDVGWENRFLRNKVVNKKHIFEGFHVKLYTGKKHEAIKYWEQLANLNTGRWITWNDIL